MDEFAERYGPNVATQRAILEQELRTCYNTLKLLEYRRRVEQRVAQTIGDSGTEALAAIEQDIRRVACRIEEYGALLAELPEAQAAANGVHA